MAKGMYHQIKQAWKKPDPAVLRKRMTGENQKLKLKLKNH